MKELQNTRKDFTVMKVSLLPPGWCDAWDYGVDNIVLDGGEARQLGYPSKDRRFDKTLVRKNTTQLLEKILVNCKDQVSL